MFRSWIQCSQKVQKIRFIAWEFLDIFLQVSENLIRFMIWNFISKGFSNQQDQRLRLSIWWFSQVSQNLIRFTIWNYISKGFSNKHDQRLRLSIWCHEILKKKIKISVWNTSIQQHVPYKITITCIPMPFPHWYIQAKGARVKHRQANLFAYLILKNVEKSNGVVEEMKMIKKWDEKEGF